MIVFNQFDWYVCYYKGSTWMYITEFIEKAKQYLSHHKLLYFDDIIDLINN